MRWIWIDGFTEFVSGQRATAFKHLDAADEQFQEHFPEYPVMPPSLMIEGMAQTAGILVGESRQFRENVILAKIRKARFEAYCTPGDTIQYEAILESLDESGATVSGKVFRNKKEIGQVDLMFSHVDPATNQLDLPDHNFVFTDQFIQLLDDYRAGRVTS